VALGRDNVVHLALADNRSAERIMPVLARLLHFLGADEAGNDAENDADAPQIADHRDDELSFEG
jgi:hypothetical protein